jgi:hypothetical protein
VNGYREPESEFGAVGHIGRNFLGSEGGLELARAYLAMTPDQRRALLGAARAFVS